MNNISLKKVTVAVFVTTLLSTYVSANELAEKAANIAEATAATKLDFAQIDSDKDGLISQVEAKANKMLNDAFAKVDANSDAMLSKDEFNAFVKNIK